MPNRGNPRGRGRAGYRNRESVLDRIGKAPIYAKQKYKFVKNTSNISAIAVLPAESRIKFIVRRFIKNYYDSFDEHGRANLVTYYSPDAFFSISASHPMQILATLKNGADVANVGRNLIEAKEPENRVRLLYYNKTNIAQCLALLSPTEHLVNYLTYDVPYYIANPMSVVAFQIVVTGLFKDTTQTTNPLIAFTRVFVIKQVSVDKQGEPLYEIFNDLFMLQPPTPDQIKRYHQEAQLNRRSNANTQEKANVSSGGKSQEDVLQSIMFKTKMNRIGSLQLLEENDWDEEKSMSTFNALITENKIPQQYFTP